jgi:solute carrier family 25 oxoglutarate transporter 11
MIKVRIQILGEGQKGVKVSANPFSLAAQLIKDEGFFSLYKGLSAGLLRQATYTTARLGIFRTVSDAMATPDKKPLPFWKKTVAGLAAGGLGSVFGTPADVALIRMQTDSKLPKEQRRNYKHVGDALMQMWRKEGLAGMFAGNMPVVYRAMSLNVGMLTTYDQAVEELKKYSSNDDLVKTGAKLLSGFFASFFSLPFDFVKTRMQKQVRDKDGNVKYKNFVNCVTTVAKEEGAGAFYRGFWTYYVRIAPHAMITLWALEKIELYAKPYGL